MGRKLGFMMSFYLVQNQQRVKLPYDLIFPQQRREVKIMLAALSDGGAPRLLRIRHKI